MAQKKNIAEQMTSAYQQAMDEQDVGSRLLKLERLDQKISQIREIPKSAFQTTIAGLGVSLLVGIIGMHFTPLASGLALIEGAAVAAGIGAGWLGGGFIFGDTAIGEKIEEKVRAHRNAAITTKYMRKISPHLPVLERISKNIAEEKTRILDSDLVLDLQYSKSLSDVVVKFPQVTEAFNAAQAKQVANDVLPGSKLRQGLSL